MGEFEEKLNSILSSPKDMEKILGLAKQLSGSFTPPQTGTVENKIQDNFGDIDPKIMSMIGRIMGEYKKHDDKGKTALINSIKPYLREERRSELERAARAARIAHIAKVVFAEFSGGEFHT